MKDTLKDTLKFAKELWIRLLDDGSIRWKQESLNEYGHKYEYDVVMKKVKEKPHLRTILVHHDGELIDEATFIYESDQEIETTLPVQHAQLIIDNYERDFKFKLYLGSQKNVVNWNEFKEKSKPSGTHTATAQAYGGKLEKIELPNQSRRKAK